MNLEKSLILNKYLLYLFGFENFSDFKREFENKREGFDSDGKSYFADVIVGLENLRLALEEILVYDHSIKEYVERLSKNRRENINLKYFQYLAVLFTEIFLDTTAEKNS